MLKRFLFRPHDHVRLQIGVHVIEIIAVTGYADQKVAIIFRTFLGSIKRLRIDDIELDVMSAQSEIAADQRRQLGDILRFNRLGRKRWFSNVPPLFTWSSLPSDLMTADGPCVSAP